MIRPQIDLGPVPTVATPFSHADFDRVLYQFVDANGRVDYAALQQRPEDLDRYYQLIATYSPDSDPAAFPTNASKLAYWINAYNAAAMKTVLTYYPITSIGDIKPPVLLFFLPRKSGFFLLQRIVIGGETTSLYALEHAVVRRRFREPRVHFALNCASRGCPRLPRQAFVDERLDAQLERETRRFFAEPRNLRVDHGQQTIFLSSILKWYEDDFREWYEATRPDQTFILSRYAALYAPPGTAADLDRAATYRIEFVPYDWELNDQETHP